MSEQLPEHKALHKQWSYLGKGTLPFDSTCEACIIDKYAPAIRAALLPAVAAPGADATKGASGG